MLALSTTQVWVHDQDEALSFWTEKVGFEVKEDVTVAELGNFRWLTVGPPGESGTAIVLMAIPGPPVMDDATKAQVQDIVAKGFATGLFFTTDDAMAAYERLAAQGVDVGDAPVQQPYGIDFGFRDPSGNNYRVAQRMPMR
ncbi:MAG: VOC family protein [Frankiales bacterium]|nr:VOC family protein [Frankiales bacterium]